MSIYQFTTNKFVFKTYIIRDALPVNEARFEFVVLGIFYRDSRNTLYFIKWRHLSSQATLTISTIDHGITFLKTYKHHYIICNLVFFFFFFRPK